MSDNESEEKQFEIEIAKNGRAGCKKCKQKCLQGDIRIAKIVPNPFGEGKMKSWHHLDCLFEVFKKQRQTTKRIESEDDIGGFNELSTNDKENIRSKINEINAVFGVTVSKKPKAKNEHKHASHNKNKESPGSSKKNSPEASEDDKFQIFQNIVKKVSDHASYLDKTNIIRKFFTNGTSGKGFTSNVEIWCRLLLPQSNKQVYNLQSKQLVKLFSRILSGDQEEMLEHLEQGDIAETIRHFYTQSSKYKNIPKNSTITVQEVDNFLNNLSKLTREEDQINHFEKILRKLTSDDLKTIIRLIKHDLRMNAGPKHILNGIHPDAYDIYNTSKNLDDIVSRCFGSTKVQNAAIQLMTPVFPMLAEACKSIEMAMKKCPNGMFSEIKYDGERVQVHKHGTEFKYFSRALKPVLPHKVSHFKDHISKAFPNANDLILDSEILMIDTNTGQPLPFGTLGKHKKAEFRDASVCLFVFDCLYYNGESLLDKPLKERKKILNENMIEIPNHIVFSEMKEINAPEALTKMIAHTFKMNLEGLVLKDIMSKYEPAKRHWLKVKKDYLFDGAMADSADLIVLGAWYGTGKKGGMMSVFLMGCYDPIIKRFCTVTKVHTGHDDKTLEKLQKELKMEKISGDPDKVPSWLKCTRTMVPDFVAVDPKDQPVWEITGAEFTQHDVHTADGISIRFPRVTKIRKDKCWETATNLDELKALFKTSKENFDVNLLMKEFKNDGIAIGQKRKCDDGDERLTKKTKKSPSKNGSNITVESSNSINCSPTPSSSNSSDKALSYIEKDDSPRQKKTVKKHKDSFDINDISQNSSGSKRKKVHLTDGLPDYFDDVKAYFENRNDDILRYLVAYGGEVIDLDSSTNITHVIHAKNYVRKVNHSYPKLARHVHSQWIVDSVNNGKLLDWQKYAVSWEPKENISCDYLNKFN